jgi:hypothetical protein
MSATIHPWRSFSSAPRYRYREEAPSDEGYRRQSSSAYRFTAARGSGEHRKKRAERLSRPARISQPKETAEPYLGAIAAASNEIRGNQEIRSSAPASRGAWWPVPARPCRLITIGWVGALTVEVANTSGVNASLRVLLRDVAGSGKDKPSRASARGPRVLGRASKNPQRVPQLLAITVI